MQIPMLTGFRGLGTDRKGFPRRSVVIVGAVLVGALATTVPSSATPARTTASTSPTWICQPGALSDPCEYGLGATAVSATGSTTTATWPSSSTAATFNCFYVYPTVSAANTANAGLNVTAVERAVAVSQAAPFSNVCNVWAPTYRSQTTLTVTKGLSGDESLLHSTFVIAYDSLLSEWQWFLTHDDHDKPIILIGDSQGSAMLIHLISTKIDHQPSVLDHLVVAIIVGGNLQVPTGKTVGATFSKVPLCRSSTETGCAIAFSSFPSQPPSDSVFGRVGQGVSLQSDQTATHGQQVACTNPAALGGGSGTLSPFYLTATQSLTTAVATPWVNYPNLYSASCKSANGATWLQIASDSNRHDSRPHVSEDLGPTWGYHTDEFALTLGNLLRDVVSEEASWKHR